MSLNATLVSSGISVKVYKHRERGTYINAFDCTTEYKKEELIFKNK